MKFWFKIGICQLIIKKKAKQTTEQTNQPKIYSTHDHVGNGKKDVFEEILFWSLAAHICLQALFSI